MINKISILLLHFFCTTNIFCQDTIEIRTGKGQDAIEFDKINNSKTIFNEGDILKIFITVKGKIDNTKTYQLYFNKSKGDCGSSFKGNVKNFESGCGKDLRGESLSIKDESNNDLFTFFLSKPVEKKTDPTNILKPAIEEIKSKFSQLSSTVYGLQVPGGNRNTAYTGRKYVHIFLDQFGNNVFSTIPQGISNRQYIVHIFYLENENDPNQVNYSVNQTSGEFQDALVFNNAGQLSTFVYKGGNDGPDVKYRWANKEFLLSTSTTNIQFEVVRTALKDQHVQKQEFETQILKTYTIKMSKVYHGSIDVGLVNSTLANPTYELLTSPSNSNEKVVKENEGSNRGVVTAMATFYTSPIILVEKLLRLKNIPDYQLSGRNFLEDHKIYERIYPAIGVGFTDKTFNNLFYGFNWEFARGGSVFVGWHYGKVNYYNKPDNFKFESTPVTEDEFKLKKNTAWKTKFAVGFNLDIMIIRNLFTGAASGTNN